MKNYLNNKTIILGAGLSGISSSYHLGHENCLVFEKNEYLGGHILSENIDGFIWDEGPHVSFTKNEYVKNLFAENVDQDFFEYDVITASFYKDKWLPHPAQSNLWSVDQPLRDECLNSFLNSRNQNINVPSNYEEWCKIAFGEVFYENFPKIYTLKYWTLEPSQLTTDWVGDRIYLPEVNEVKQGYLMPLENNTHYITRIRYPKNGGYFSFVSKLKENINCKFKMELTRISFEKKEIIFNEPRGI